MILFYFLLGIVLIACAIIIEAWIRWFDENAPLLIALIIIIATAYFVGYLAGLALRI